MRELLFDYVVMLANTGMRHGTETQNLSWRHVTVFEDGGRQYVELSVSGKTGRRDLICREGTFDVLRRIQGRSDDIAAMKFDALLTAKLDLRQCQEFRVRGGIMGKKETPYGTTQSPCDSR